MSRTDQTEKALFFPGFNIPREGTDCPSLRHLSSVGRATGEHGEQIVCSHGYSVNQEEVVPKISG